jgi:DNA-directed RNA polymerase specialized sigma24 family protein
MLPGRQRVALWLRFGVDLPFPEIGRVMGISERAAIQLVWRARQALRRTLVGIGGSEP